MRLLLTLSILLLSSSCINTKNLTTDQVVGTYQWHPFYGVGASMELKSDSSFEYNWQTGLNSGTTLGTWKLAGKNIALNSDLQPPEQDTGSYELVKLERNNSDSLTIKVLDAFGNQSMPFANCTLIMDSRLLDCVATNMEGEVTFPKSDADSLIISFIGFHTIKYRIDPSVSTYVFKLKEADQTHYVYFTTEIWRYRNGQLCVFDNLKAGSRREDCFERVD